MKLKDNFTAYIFLIPFLCIFTIFLLIPVFYSFWLSFYKVGVYTDLFDVFSKMEWVGWGNSIAVQGSFLFVFDGIMGWKFQQYK